MYDRNDPRAGLAPAGTGGPPPTGLIAEPQLGLFYQETPSTDDASGRTWFHRGCNFVVAWTDAAPGGTFDRQAQPDEYAVILPDADRGARITWNGRSVDVPGFSVAFVPAGESRIEMQDGGPLTRLFTVRSDDLVARCSNAGAYEAGRAHIPPFEPWPDPAGGWTVRHYSLDVPKEAGRFGRIFRCTTFMVNYLDPAEGPRDTTKLSPHHHDDFEQLSLAVAGSFIHHIRWPWTIDMADWKDDRHDHVQSPSAYVIPPPVIHTTRAMEPGTNQLVDIFCPPRIDFSMKPGWVLNADDYPMPKSALRNTAMSETLTESRDAEVAELLKGAVDLHCHSGPAAMPRILDHHEALLDAADAGFRALLFKDHFYLGVAHCVMLEKLVPTDVKLFSGLALNNASGGINPHAVNHAINIGARIIWLPTLSAKNHIEQLEGQGKSFPKTAKRMLPPEPLSALDANGRVSDETKACLDLIAEGDIILSGGHLPASELIMVFEEAGRRGVKKMLVNHPTYIVGCTDDDMKALVELGAYLEHSICMFIEGNAKHFTPQDLAHYIEVAGVDRTVLSSDLGLRGSPRPLVGFRDIVAMLLDLQVSPADIRKMVGDNAAGLLNLH